MEEAAYRESYRVLKPGGVALLNLHHPNLIPEDLDDRLKKPKLSQIKKEVFRFWQYLRDNRVLFESAEQIEKTFGAIGFQIETIRVDRDRIDKLWTDKWWSVKLRK